MLLLCYPLFEIADAVLVEWILILLEKNFRQDLQDKHDFFCSDHFPEESDPTQSAFSGKKPTINDIRHQPKVIGHDLGTLKIPTSPKVTFAPRAHWVRLFSSLRAVGPTGRKPENGLKKPCKSC